MQLLENLSYNIGLTMYSCIMLAWHSAYANVSVGLLKLYQLPFDRLYSDVPCDIHVPLAKWRHRSAQTSIIGTDVKKFKQNGR